MKSTSQMTSVPAPPLSPKGFNSITRHSSFALASRTIGGLTVTALSFLNPAFRNSSTPSSYSQEAREACPTISLVTILITTSGTSIKLCKVCFIVLSLIRRRGEKITMGGLDENRLKNENGLRLTLPCRSIVDASAMGLGATRLVRHRYTSGDDSSFTS